MAGLQALAPSLAKAPSVPSATGPTFQPTGVLAGLAPRGDELDKDYVYNPTTGKFVQVVHSPARDTHQVETNRTRIRQPVSVSDVETSEDEDCGLEPPSGYCFVWKRDNCGEKEED